MFGAQRRSAAPPTVEWLLQYLTPTQNIEKKMKMNAGERFRGLRSFSRTEHAADSVGKLSFCREQYEELAPLVRNVLDASCRFCCYCCCFCSHFKCDNQVRVHRTRSSYSGAEEYPRERTQTTQRWYTHVSQLTQFMPICVASESPRCLSPSWEATPVSISNILIAMEALTNSTSSLYFLL